MEEFNCQSEEIKSGAESSYNEIQNCLKHETLSVQRDEKLVMRT